MQTNSLSGSGSNQEKIQQLREKLKTVESLHPKSPPQSSNNIQLSPSPIEDLSQQGSKLHLRSAVKSAEAVFPLELKYSDL